MKVIRWLDKNFEVFLMSVLLVVLTLIMFVQVIMRYGFNSSLTWAEEACRYLFVWFSCFSLGYCVSHNNHLRIDMVENAVPGPVRKFLQLLSTVLQAFFAIALIIGGPELCIRAATNGQTSTSMRMPMQYVYVSLFVGSILMALRILERTVKTILLAKKERGEEE
jgi:TRAP-type C4-dicarboxylate transport system permease small subunit